MKQIEILLILGLIAWQLVVFIRNRRLIGQVAGLYPDGGTVRLGQQVLPDGGANVEVVVLPADASEQFATIVQDTNEYLTNNYGAAADFNILKDISERHTEALDEEIQAQIATPLYLGLLGTFLGAMFGLASLLLHTGAAAGGGFLRDEQIISFLWGVAIAMVGSFAGLAFTLWGNQSLKVARARRDQRKNAYYTFLQKALLPRLNSDMQKSMGDLKAVLDTFNKDFFGRIQEDFFAKFAQILPLMDRMGENIDKTTENITVQRDFLDKLQSIGYTQLANATIRVFDRVDQSAASFDRFLGYQQALNHTVQMGIEATSTMAALLGRLDSVEQAARLLPEFINKHDDALRQMLAFFQAHQATLGDLRARMEQHLDTGARSLEGIVERRIQEMQAEYQQADDRLRQYFASLNDQNIYDKVVRYLQPFSELPGRQDKLNTQQEQQGRQIAQALRQLEERLAADEAIQRQLLKQIEQLTRVQADLAQPGFLGKMFGQKPKDYFGPTAPR